AQEIDDPFTSVKGKGKEKSPTKSRHDKITEGKRSSANGTNKQQKKAKNKSKKLCAEPIWSS
ncbi:MAG: hypothetical protein L0G95_02935, partial [Planococcus sp. (in: firmicutes)]|nr:hypothetical protein [Planococcus sp. (in: firmicutes)]